ncbi:MAG: right-handed parallel beta-helix repeat-containing protein [Anaerolineaceae bacterium]|nr:right-handed parallel beta-helix repeat-containing protein [Anaerolineaceae bacterium]
MKTNRTFSKITSLILVLTLFFSMQTSTVLAEDSATPESTASEAAPTESVEEAVENTPEPENPQEIPEEETGTAAESTLEQTKNPVSETEPAVEAAQEQTETQAVENMPTIEGTEQDASADESPSEADASESTPVETQSLETPTAEAAVDPEISEILAAADEADVELIPLNEEDEITPMGSNEAAEILSGGDPYFEDASGNWIGYTSLTGTCPAIVTTCNQVAAPVQAAIDAAPVNAYIYVEKDTYVEDIIINKSLTLTGLWQGNEDFADRPTLQGSVTITADYVYFENWIVDATGKTYGIEVQGDGVMIDNSHVMNATGANIFINNADNAIIANNTIENSNGGDGILVVNANLTDIEENVINNNWDASPGSAGGINLVNSTNNIIYQNNITNNEIGIINGTVTQVDARNNYFNGNNSDVFGDVLINSSYPEVSLPIDWGFPPAPGTIPNEEIDPPSDDFIEFYHPIDGDYSELDCGMIWDANRDIDKTGEFQRYVNDVWVRYDANLGGFVHDMGQEDNVQYLRKTDGSWHLISADGEMSAMSEIDDNNWSVLDGNWCLNPDGGHLKYDDCFLYYYENNVFKWAMNTQDRKYYDYDVEMASWIPRS